MTMNWQRSCIELCLIVVLVLVLNHLKRVAVGYEEVNNSLALAEQRTRASGGAAGSGENVALESEANAQIEFEKERSSQVQPQFTEGGRYILPDWSQVHPRLKSSKRLTVDFEIRFHTDMYNLSDSEFAVDDTLRAFQIVANIWAKANIWTRFKVDEIKRKIKLPDDKGDAYRWWIQAVKSNKERYKSIFKRDYNAYLVDGPGGLGVSGAQTVVKKYFAHGGHDLFNWILGAGPDRLGKIGPPIRLYFVYYFPWYNGMGNKRRIYIRSGSCNSKPPKMLNRKPVECVGWGKRYWEDGSMKIDELIRIVAHEIGHTFGLHHPGNKCVAFRRTSDMLLMLQQRKTTLIGTPCSTRNKYARFARHLPFESCVRARTVAKRIEQDQAAYLLETENSIVSPNMTEIQLENAIHSDSDT